MYIKKLKNILKNDINIMKIFYGERNEEKKGKS
jgi:hypothetical protein